MEPKLNDKYCKIISYIRKELKNQQLKINLLFKEFMHSIANKRKKYLVQIMQKMNCTENGVVIEPNYEIFYHKFFDMAKKIFEDKNNSYNIRISISGHDLENFEEKKKIIILLYLKFSVLVENSLEIFFAFLNYKNSEILLTSKFTFLDYESIENIEGLKKSFRLELKSEEHSKKQSNKEIDLINFEEITTKYLEPKENSNRTKNDIKVERVTINLDEKKNQFTKEIKPENTNNKINLNINSKSLVHNQDKINNTNLKEEKYAEKFKPNFQIREKNLSSIANINSEKEKGTKKQENNKQNIYNNKITEIKINQEKSKEHEINTIIYISPKKDLEKELQKDKSIEKVQEANKAIKGKIIDIKRVKPINEKKSFDNNSNTKNKCLSSNEINESKDITNMLKKNLLCQTVTSYIASQKIKYQQIYKDNFILKDIIKNFVFDSRLFPSFNNIKYINVQHALNNMIAFFSNGTNIVKPQYGFTIIKNNIYFYTSDNVKEEEEIMFNAEFLKQIDYDYAYKKESSFKTYPCNEANKIDYFLIKGMDFEKNFEFFFDSYFSLTKLPNYLFPAKLFPVNTSEIKETEIFKDYIENLFNTFIETDIARLNKRDSDIKPKIFFKPYINNNSFYVYYQKQNRQWNYRIITCEEFIIYKNSIVLCEIKHSIPEKILNIEENDLINKKDIQRALYFVILKLIKKIDFYIDLIKYEFLNDAEQITSYSIQLFLIYNNKPIYDINSSIQKCIQNLILHNLIKHNFYFQVVYAVPALSSLNIYNLNEKIEKANQQIELLQKKDELKNEQIIELKDQIKILQDKVNQLQ